MTNEQKDKIINTILQSCLFSEYLPNEFNSEKLTQKCFVSKFPNYSLKPVEFTMDKFNDLGNRRYIAIPEIWSFLDAVVALNNGNILQDIIKLNNSNLHTLSHILDEEENIKRFSEGYEFKIDKTKKIINSEIERDFCKNLQLKIEKSNGCECILHLDISNFFNSIYTHNITAITKGEEWANFQYHQQGTQDTEYIQLHNLDNKIAAMNQKRTHGILTGPRLSFIIAESLLTIIDADLESQLKDLDIDFVRYVDDYDLFIKDKSKIEQATYIFNKTLQKYGLSINDSKTKIEDFPFYVYRDYDKYLDTTDNLFNTYAKYANIEKSCAQHGAILYFCQNILPLYPDNDTALSLSFSILKNISKSLVSSCKNIASFKTTEKNKEVIYLMLKQMLNDYAKKHMDLECIWILYTLLKIFPEVSVDNNTLLQLNELCLIIYFYESKNGKTEQTIIQKAEECGWLFNYELFFNNIISIDDLKKNLKIDDATPYEFLKNQQINFYTNSK